MTELIGPGTPCMYCGEGYGMHEKDCKRPQPKAVTGAECAALVLEWKHRESVSERSFEEHYAFYHFMRQHGQTFRERLRELEAENERLRQQVTERPKTKQVRIGDKQVACEPLTLAREIVRLSGQPSEGVRAVRQFFVDGERQRYWPVNWPMDVIFVEDGDSFAVEYGELCQVPPTRDASLMEENRRLQEQVAGLAERIAAQSELLSKRAE